jgi:DNA-binding CsgD family transcriptional regulator
MFENLLQRLEVAVGDCQERACGAAFFRVAREAYPLSSIVYVAINVPLPRGKAEGFVHCTYSDAWARHITSKDRVNVGRVGLGGLFTAEEDRKTSSFGTESAMLGKRQLSLALTGYHAESAALVIGGDERIDDWPERRATLTRELRALGQYFHQHMLRIFGRGNERAIIVTAREIDCLRWMAAGKTAFEVSAILGISERTVRFHLNAAREKLYCTTTTQAVAKAVSQQLFVP